jgi:predicted NBD/HSP70 family sugar kinase
MMLSEMRSRGLTVKSVQEFNRRVILRLIYEKKLCSRTEIVESSSLDASTVTRVVQQLVDDGFVEESILQKGENQRGRRSIGLRIAADPHRVLVVRLQRLNFQVAMLDLRGSILKSAEVQIKPISTAENIFEQIVESLNSFLDLCKENLLGIGVTLPGPFLEDSERIALITETTDWRQFDLIQRLRVHYQQIPVYSKHDAKAAALAVWISQGLDSNSKVTLYLSAGQGIGSGLVLSGEVFRGSLGTAGEIGHTSIDLNGPLCKCGNRGCLEIYSSSLALLRNLEVNWQEISSRSISFEEVVVAYHEQQPVVEKEVELVAKYLAQGLINCINLINPDLIVIGDEYARFGERFLNIIKSHLQTSTLPSVFKNINFQLAPQTDLVINGSFHHVIQSELL